MSNFMTEGFCPNCNRIHQLEWHDLGRDGYQVRCSVAPNGEVWREEDWVETVLEFKARMIPSHMNIDKRPKFVTVEDLHFFFDEVYAEQEAELNGWIDRCFRPVAPELLTKLVPDFVYHKHEIQKILLQKLQSWMDEYVQP